MKNEFDYLNDVKMDFSVYGEESISEQEVKCMKNNVRNSSKKVRAKKLYVMAACIATVVITGTVFAMGYAGNIIKQVSTGHNNFIQVDSKAPQELPEELKGKLFDKSGIPYESISNKDLDNLYDENGQKLDKQGFADVYQEAFGGMVKISSGDYDPEKAEKSYATIEEAQAIAEFDIKVPEYLPAGYSLSRAYTYKGDDGSVSGLYMTLEYKNEKNKKIVIFERLLNEETAFEAGGDSEIEETEINGHKAVITGGRSIDWETEDSVSVGISGQGNISRAELIKMAQSVK